MLLGCLLRDLPFFAFSAKHAICVLSALALTVAAICNSNIALRDTILVGFFIITPATYGWGIATMVTKSSFIEVTAGKIAGAIVAPIILYLVMNGGRYMLGYDGLPLSSYLW